MVHGIKEKDGSVFKLVVIYKKIFYIINRF